jgi:hypothetical protein
MRISEIRKHRSRWTASIRETARSMSLRNNRISEFRTNEELKVSLA